MVSFWTTCKEWELKLFSLVGDSGPICVGRRVRIGLVVPDLWDAAGSVLSPLIFNINWIGK